VRRCDLVQDRQTTLFKGTGRNLSYVHGHSL
jgi:hypothetical protein